MKYSIGNGNEVKNGYLINYFDFLSRILRQFYIMFLGNSLQNEKEMKYKVVSKFYFENYFIDQIYNLFFQIW